MSESIPTAAEVKKFLSESSNWGRWGADDELGAVNLIGPEKRLEAAATVRSGRSVSLAREVPKHPAPNNPRPAHHYMHTFDRGDGTGAGAALDYYGMDYHGIATTHIDALCHIWDSGGGWNGRDPLASLTYDGSSWGGVEHWRDGIVTRAVLLDIPSYRGVPYVDDGQPVHAHELRAAAAAQRSEIRPGDAVVVYSGRAAYERDKGPWYAGTTCPGLHASCLWFLKETDCSALVWDMQDVRPTGYEGELGFTVHASSYALGIVLVDNAQLEVAAQVCAEEQRHEFMLTIAPLVMRGGTGSPVNPIALF
jgi:kynurenine formamidase